MEEKKKIFKGSFNELDQHLQKHLTIKLLYCIALALLTIGIGLFYKNITLFLMLLVAFLLFLAYSYYELTLCLQDKLVFIDGEIAELHEKSKIKGTIGIDRNYILLKQENVYIKIYKENINGFKEGNLIKAYIKPTALRPINEDTFECTSVFHVVKLKEQ